MNQNETPDIPAYGTPEFDEALSALVRSAGVLRKALLLIAGAGADPQRVLNDHGEVLMQAEAVVRAWSAHMGIDVE